MTNNLESRLQQGIRQTESQIDAETRHRLEEIRKTALSEENRWFGEYRRSALAGLIVLLMVAAMVNPLQSPRVNQIQDFSATGEPIEILMEDPSFYIWLDKSGQLVAER